jgi:hypothetical protein
MYCVPADDVETRSSPTLKTAVALPLVVTS